MSRWFVSRHPGAVEWIREMDVEIDHWVAHLDPSELSPGDIVIGTLPLPQVAGLQGRGVTYWHLTLDLPADMRGRELSVDDMRRCGVQLQCYQVALVDTWLAPEK
jgi:CRISPR-associated protein Csx16